METEYAPVPPRGREWGVAPNGDGTFDVYDLTNGRVYVALPATGGGWTLHRRDADMEQVDLLDDEVALRAKLTEMMALRRVA